MARPPLISVLVVGGLLAAGPTPRPASAFDFAAVRPLDEASVDPGLLAGVFGRWDIRHRDGRTTCHVTLTKEPSIGGYSIDIAPACVAQFPALADVTAWRLLENWTIDLVDPLRHTRIRFETPDERYVAFGEAADIKDIAEFVKREGKPASR